MALGYLAIHATQEKGLAINSTHCVKKVSDCPHRDEAIFSTILRSKSLDTLKYTRAGPTDDCILLERSKELYEFPSFSCVGQFSESEDWVRGSDTGTHRVSRAILPLNVNAGYVEKFFHFRHLFA